MTALTLQVGKSADGSDLRTAVTCAQGCHRLPSDIGDFFQFASSTSIVVALWGVSGVWSSNRVRISRRVGARMGSAGQARKGGGQVT